MAPFLCPEALWTGVRPLFSTNPDVVPLFLSAAASCLCCVLTGSSVAVWQCQPSSAGGEADDRAHSPMTEERKLHLKLRKILGRTREQGWINNCGNWALPSIFLFPLPWRVCTALCLSCTSPYVRPPPPPPPPLKTQTPRLPCARSRSMNVVGRAPLPAQHS